ncbi:putative chromatin regulator PHD family [Rosa chinensis]|uniref:Putative chromatin regulator PHD family n=1 Tax=Rosa chinensis TaxID=74649 RepID=A0A2P6RDL6_ROSCH|nr:putative chromatin regulator PHD family [Rosa chinensis]
MRVTKNAATGSLIVASSVISTLTKTVLSIGLVLNISATSIHYCWRESQKKEYIGPRFCDGCQDQILGPSYTCINTFQRRKCGFNLHQKCAELPHEIEHPMHRQHPLFLLNIFQDMKLSRLCIVCNQPCRFPYSCSICDFNLDLRCASNWKALWEMTLICISLWLPGRKCTTSTSIVIICQLLVHKECASLPSNIKIPCHQHRLKLNWCLEDIYPNHPSCKVCYASIDKSRAVYYCDECSSFVAHIACKTAEYSWEEENAGRATNDDDSDDAPIKHFSHQHLLAASDHCEVVKDDRRVITCEGCIQPINSRTDSFYSCTKQGDELCSFFLHKKCAQLPREMRLPLLHQHQFTLLSRAPSIGGVFQCYITYWEIKALKHDSHVHRLLLNPKSKDIYCNGCGSNMYFFFSCKRCDFHLCIPCVRLPLTAMYRYDDHPLKLTYASVEDELGYY